MKRVLVRSVGVACACLVAMVALVVVVPGAHADGTASWSSAPAQPPPPPSGGEPSPYPLPIGYIGDIEFWAPNRGLLITAGTSVVSPGLFAYDGVSWHQLSTVCGGTDGRIAWSGPDEFWTISDQRQGQILPAGGQGAFEDVSLCHFLNGQVVASYALPLEQPNSYQPMNAAACDAPSDCWFGGHLDANGAFHLHWDGTNLTQVDSPYDHAVASMTVEDGEIFESVQPAAGDSYGYDNETAAQPFLLHHIAPTDAARPFHRVSMPNTQDPACGTLCPGLPEYGTPPAANAGMPAGLGGLALSSDWSTGAATPQMWAAAGPQPGSTSQSLILRFAAGQWTQVMPNPAQAPGDLQSLPGDFAPIEGLGATPTPRTVAAEPGVPAAWIAVASTGSPDNAAHALRVAVNPDGTASVTDQDVLGAAAGAGCPPADAAACVGPKGPASAIACPADADCWVTTTQGWLFHLSDGTQRAQDTDPNFQSVITYRPPDAGVPKVILSVGIPTSLAPPPAPPPPPPPPAPRRVRPLVSQIGRGHLIRGTTLVLPFTLTGPARVQLVARRHGRIVARTPRRTLGAGRHQLALRLDRHRWPTALALNAVPARP